MEGLPRNATKSIERLVVSSVHDEKEETPYAVDAGSFVSSVPSRRRAKTTNQLPLAANKQEER